MEAESSYRRTIERFDTARVADHYPAEYGRSFRERRERACLRRIIARLPAGGRVLDLPCGTGRVTRLLLEAGMQVTAADASPHMVETARRNLSGLNHESASRVRFETREIARTGYPDDAFDAILCNRLFHHFPEAGTRVAALRELGRICPGPIAASFFNTLALDSLRYGFKQLIRRRTRRDRIPISLRTFRKDAAAAGLELTGAVPILWGVSPMWYAIVQRTTAKS